MQYEKVTQKQDTSTSKMPPVEQGGMHSDPGPYTPGSPLVQHYRNIGNQAVLRLMESETIMRDAASLKETIEDELDSAYVSMENVWPAIQSEDPTQRDIVRQDAQLEAKVRSEADEMEILKTYLFLTYGHETNFPVHFEAIIEATEIAGTHEARIFMILRSVSQSERVELRDMPGLKEVLRDEMSGSELDLAIELLSEDIEPTQTGEATSTPSESTHLERGERLSLNEAAAGGTSFETLKRYVGRAANMESPETILNDTSLWGMLADRFYDEEVWYLRVIATFRGRSFPRLPGQDAPYITTIWNSVEGPGTDENQLIDQLQRVNTVPAERQKLVEEPWLVPMLESELSGQDLQSALTAVSVTGGPEVSVRDDLEDAIDDQDMVRVREILIDVNLSSTDRTRLKNDPVILDEMGEELNAVQLCETSQLLKYGSSPSPGNVTTLLEKFKQSPIDVTGAVLFLENLDRVYQDVLRREPGVFFMLTNSELSIDETSSLLAAVRSKVEDLRLDEEFRRKWQVSGSVGTHRAVLQSVTATLPVHFGSSEIRIALRICIDTSRASEGYEVSSDMIEGWTRELDETWNNKYRLRSGSRTFNLVFATYMAVDLASPHSTIYVYNRTGRSFQRGKDMHLFLEGLHGMGLASGTVAHEFGHLVGNPDEYSLPASEYQKFTGETVEPQRGGHSVENLMGSTSQSTAVEIRHFQPTAEIVNVARDTGEFPEPFDLEKM